MRPLSILFMITFSLSLFPERAQAASLDERVAGYRAILWPITIEKEYNTDHQACLDMLAEESLAKRYIETYEIEPDLATQIRRTQHFFRYMTLMKSAVINPAIPSDEEIETFYQKHHSAYSQPEQVQVQIIFLEFGPDPTSPRKQKVLQHAREVHNLATQGEEFSSLVQRYSDNKENRGIVGPFTRNTYNPILTENAFALEPGEISEPFTTEQGCFILKCLDKIPAGTLPLEEVKLPVRIQLEKPSRQRLRANLVTRAMQELQIKVFADRYSPNHYNQDRDQTVITGNDFTYTKQDLLDLFPDYHPKNNPESSQNFNTIVEMLALDQLFQHSSQAQTSQALAGMKFVEAYHLSQAYLQKTVEKKTFTEKELRDYYSSRSNSFLSPIERELSLIRVRASASAQASPAQQHYAKRQARQKIEKALNLIEEGSNFTEVAREYSDDPSSKRGGYLGYIQEPSSALIDTTAAQLEPGQISSIQEKGDSFFILKLHTVKERTRLSYEQVRPRIASLIREDYSRDLWKAAQQEIECHCAGQSDEK